MFIVYIHLNILSHVPSEVDHRHDALVSLFLVPLIPLNSSAVLPVGERPGVPGNVVAPAGGLHPVDAAGVDPDHLPRPLHEPVAGDLPLLQVGHLRPPRAVQVVHTVLLAELLQGAPVLVGHSEPLAVPGADVDVDSCKVVVLLVAGGPGSRHLQANKHFNRKSE